MKNPISSFRAWLGTSTVPSRAGESQHAPQERAGSSRKMTVAPALGALKRQNARRVMPDATPSSSHRPPPSSSSDDEELRQAVAAIRAAAVWTPPSSRAESPRVSLSDRSRLSSARIDASPGRDTHSLRTDGSSGHHRAGSQPIDEDREALLDMAWDVDFPSARMNEILARSPELVDAPDHSGATLLMNALTGGNVEFAKTLIDHGADPNVRDELGNTPLHLAAGRGTEIVSQLLAAGADPSATNNRGATALFDARSPEVVHLLLRAGTPIDARDENGNTAIMRLAQSGTRPTVLALLEHDPDISLRNRSNRTFAQLLTARLGGTAEVIPKTAAGAKAVLELGARETPFLGDLRDRKPALAGTLRPSARVAPEEELRIQPELKMAASPNAKRPAINSLKSGPKLSFVNDPKRAFDELSHRDVEALSEALGFGKLSSDPDKYMQKKAAVRATFARFRADIERFLADYDNAALDHEALNAPLSQEERAELRSVMDIAHLRVAAERGPGGGLLEPLRLRVFFGGSQNMRDFKQDIGSAFGRIGEVDRAAKRAGELFAKILSHPDHVQLDFVGGHSMGGAMAQTFLASVESRVLLPKQPSMILMDPQLLNNNQARRATKGGTLEVDYAQPRGVAITLDYANDPRRGLMGIMKGPGGYRYPGLVQLKLGLTDTDGYRGSRPETSGPPGLGYHVDPQQFANALSRFCADREQEILDDPALDHLRAPNWTRPAGPVRTSNTLPAVARRARRPMEPIVEDEESARET